MVSLRTVAALVGLLAGAWAFAGAEFYEVGRATCTTNPLQPCGSTPPPNVFILALALLLETNSIICLFGPNMLFYASAGLSVLLGVSMVPNSSLIEPIVVVGLGLSAASFVVSLVAARRSTGISEQSNPMNLPVFG